MTSRARPGQNLPAATRPPASRVRPRPPMPERTRRLLAALGLRMKDVSLEPHPDKTRIIYCKESTRSQ
jgi:hypothetical protein